VGAHQGGSTKRKKYRFCVKISKGLDPKKDVVRFKKKSCLISFVINVTKKLAGTA